MLHHNIAQGFIQRKDFHYSPSLPLQKSWTQIAYIHFVLACPPMAPMLVNPYLLIIHSIGK